MSGTPNLLASVVLLLWPLASWLLFKRLGAAKGLVASLVVAYLILPPSPAGFDLPVTTLNKETLPSLVVLVIYFALYRPGTTLMPTSPLLRSLVVVYVLSPWATILTNAEPVSWGIVFLPGLSLREGVAASIHQILLISPLLLARALLSREEDHRILLWALLVGGLAYSLPMLVEVRLSPQINVWVYGYFQHSFDQMMRGGGFRPIVFLYHGLWVAFFAMTGVLAACALLRDAGTARWRTRYGIAAAWMLGMLVLCKSLASLIYGLVLAPVVLLASIRTQLRVAALLATLALAYPLAVVAHLMPEDRIMELASRAGPERTGSLQFRFDNEAVLIDRAQEKPFFGWGQWGRNQIFDGTSGMMTTVTDGRWIIVLGIFGWVGLVAEFGLLALPIIMAWWRIERTGDGFGPPRALASCALILGINMIDLIPNATLTPLTMLFAGAIMGWVERPSHTMSAVATMAPVFRTIL